MNPEKLEFSLSDELTKSREKRAAAFNTEWSGPISYESIGYFSVFPVLMLSCFVSYKLILSPWITVMAACTLWTVIYLIWLPSPSPVLENNLKGLEVLITMKGSAITFLLAFRLARAAVRFYDARSTPIPFWLYPVHNRQISYLQGCSREDG